MSLLTAIDINASGLMAQRKRVEVATSNLANAQTTRTENGGPYRRKDVVFQPASFDTALDAEMGNSLEGVKVSGVVEDQTPFDRQYQPGHPDADAEGYVLYPNVNAMQEMANLMSAARSYEANIASINILKTMLQRTLDIGR